VRRIIVATALGILLLLGLFLLLTRDDRPDEEAAAESARPNEHGISVARPNARTFRDVRARARQRPPAGLGEATGEGTGEPGGALAPPSEPVTAPPALGAGEPGPLPQPEPERSVEPAPAPSAQAELDLGQADAELGVPPTDPNYALRERIREGFARAIPELRDCYEGVLVDAPGLEDRLVFELLVHRIEDPRTAEEAEVGEVELISVSSEALRLEEVSCFAAAIEGLELPAPTGGADSYGVNYPVLLSPE
jgi:hypothetical protein